MRGDDEGPARHRGILHRGAAVHPAEMRGRLRRTLLSQYLLFVGLAASASDHHVMILVYRYHSLAKEL